MVVVELVIRPHRHSVTAAAFALLAALMVATHRSAAHAADAPLAQASGGADVLAGAEMAAAEQLSRALASVAARVKPAVVSVYSERLLRSVGGGVSPPLGEDLFGRLFGRSPAPPESREFRTPHRGLGSGMIIDKAGLVLTSFHIVRELDEITVQTADRRTFKATLIGADPMTDVAVVRLAGASTVALPIVRFGDSDLLKDGHLVMAIGAPFGLMQSVTTGIISAIGRSDVGIADYEDFLQTDAPINPGNSGGPLVNMRGEVIGMNSAIVSSMGLFGGGGQSAGIGFAIPANLIKAMLPQLVQGQSVLRGAVGITVQDLNADLAAYFRLGDASGALVSEVNPKSPADQAGLKVTDVVVRYRGTQVRDSRQLRNLIGASVPGTTARFGVVRDGIEQLVNVTIGKLPVGSPPASRPSVPAAEHLAALGIRAQTLVAELAAELGLRSRRGVLVVGIEEEGRAAIAGLQFADVILEVARKPVANIAELRRAIADAKSPTLLLVDRRGTRLFVALGPQQ